MDFFAVCGNISSGKTSALKALEALYLYEKSNKSEGPHSCNAIEVIYEPTESNTFKYFLNKFYSTKANGQSANLTNNLYLLQLCIYNHYLNITLKYQAGEYAGKKVFVERSPLDTLLVFLKSNKPLLLVKEYDDISTNIYDELKLMMNSLIKMEPWVSCTYIILDEELDTCISRMGIRDRIEERELNNSNEKEEYMRTLHYYYHKMIEYTNSMNNFVIIPESSMEPMDIARIIYDKFEVIEEEGPPIDVYILTN